MSRWRPQRAGICNIWRYYNEVFTFDHGRLLLRGPNGSGKSKALELLLPFLLDASIQPSRLSTFGGNSRTMHWNVMEGTTTKTRTGYVWLEVAHDDGDLVTIGAWLQASRERPTVTVNYFMTGQQVGVDLALLGPEQTPHTLAGLRAAIGEHGRVYETAEAYRTAVRERLFSGMTAERYDTLLRALLQLRTPKLSEHLDPEQLSTVLSSALPPIDEAIITELAEGFERLDQHRRDLDDLERQVKAARALADEARRYARAVIRARASALTAATGELDRASDDHRRGAERLAARERIAAEAALAHHAAIQVREECAAKIAALEKSDDYAQGRKLEDLRKHVSGAHETALRTEEDLTRAERALERAEGGSQIACALAAEQQNRIDQGGVDLVARSRRVLRGEIGMLPLMPALDDVHLPLAGVEPWESWHGGVADVLAEIDARTNLRITDIAAVSDFVQAHDRAVDERTVNETRVESARMALTAAGDTRTGALDELDLAIGAQEADVLTWMDGLVELSLDREGVVGALDDEADRARSGSTGADMEHADGMHVEMSARRDLRGLVDEALTSVKSDVSAALALESAKQSDLVARQAGAEVERMRLASDVNLAPNRPLWRTAADPDRGAPLWRLIGPREGADPGVIARLEAAFESSGLLDAWVFPDGALRLDGTDLVLSADGARPESASRSGADQDAGERLTALLAPDAEQDEVPHVVIAGILSSIGLRAGASDIDDDLGSQTWVALDGSWRLGPLRGRWMKAHAQYLGASARERHRAERLAELTELIVGLDAQIADIVDRREMQRARERSATKEAAGRPLGRRMTEASAALTRAEAAVQAANATVAQERTMLAEAERDVVRHWVAVESAGLRTGLPIARAELSRLGRDLTELTLAASTLRQGIGPAIREMQHAAESLRSAQDARVAHATLGERCAADRAAAATLAAQLDELDRTSGASFRMVRERIDQHTTQLQEADARARNHDSEARQADKDVAKLSGLLQSSTDRLAGAQQTRDATQHDLRWVLGTSLATEAGDVIPAEQVLDTVRGLLEVARAVTRATPSDSLGLIRLTSQLNDQVGAARGVLAQRADLEVNFDRDTALPVATRNGRRMSMRELSGAVTAERERAHEEITAEEHKLFRNILTGQTRRHLSARIREAQALVDDMNARLATVQTASGVQVRLVWEVRDDDGVLLAPARALLLKSAARLSDDEEQALVRFLDERISRARTVESGQPWARQLAKVFDYAQWHTFRVETTRNDGGGWSKVTKKQHSAMSGGEKAIILHLPLFAALAAHYEATPGAPRLILLDEVFVGIDTANRGQIFGLLRDLDLDFVLTSDNEWCAYPQVDGIAIHVLAADADDAAVTSTRFVWTGSELVEDAETADLLL